jgi:hypothetical protein
MLAWPNHPKRIEYFQDMLKSLAERLSASSHAMRYFCSAEIDRDPENCWYGDKLSAICHGAGIPLKWRDAPADLGANMNAALRMGSAAWQLLVQDDFELQQEVDLSKGIAFLEDHPDFAAVRYHWGLYSTKFTHEIDGFRVVDIDGPWPFSDAGQLRRRNFTATYGEYAESTTSRPVVHGGSESAMCAVLKAARAKIAASPKPVFKHIGITRAEYRDHRKSRRGDDE